MKHPIAAMSMLHERVELNSATRRFRSEPVLGWTLLRLRRCSEISNLAVICWDDQSALVTPIVEAHGGKVFTRGLRRPLSPLDALSAARRWSDGWRGGLLQTCDFDHGFDAQALLELSEELHADGIATIDPAAGLVDPGLIDALVRHARQYENQEFYFTPAAPGLGAVLLRPSILSRLAKVKLHPGKLLHYLPSSPAKDPIAGEACVPAPIPVMRSTRQFKLNSHRQIERLTRATVSRNGQLISSSSEEIVRLVGLDDGQDEMPREIRVEINTDRLANPIFWPGRYARIARPAMDAKTAGAIFTEISRYDDIRLTLAGVGDPLNHENLFEIIGMARQAGIAAISLETDLLAHADTIKQLATCGVDVVSFHVPALTAAVYQQVMGVDGHATVMANAQALVSARQNDLPIAVPVFTKCPQNLAEMESWYDQWLNALGTAVIEGPSDCAGQIPDCSVADMTPPRRTACARLSSRMTILSDGQIVSCEQDFAGRNALGRIGRETIAQVWTGKMQALRDGHRKGEWNKNALCGGCREWHRP